MAAYEWPHRFNAEGLEGLTDHPRPGRPPTYTAEQRAEVIAALTKPDALGLPFAPWTSLADIAEELIRGAREVDEQMIERLRGDLEKSRPQEWD